MQRISLELAQLSGNARETIAPRHNSSTGYGRKIPTQHMIFYASRWHRVYCAIYSNIGTCYIVHKNEWVIVD